MKKLDENWFLTGLIDLEYKKYVLLDYIQTTKKYFNKNKLYPAFSNLIDNYKSLVEYRDSINAMNNSFPKKLVSIDLEHQTMIYETIVENEFKELDVIGEIVEYSIPKLKKLIEDGKVIYESIESFIDFKLIGIEPLVRNEGYILIRVDKEVHAYRYHGFQLEGTGGEKFKTLKMEFVSKHRSSLSNNIERIKMKLINKHKDLPNPTVYFVDIDLPLPMKETILPVVKRKFLADINL